MDAPKKQINIKCIRHKWQGNNLPKSCVIMLITDYNNYKKHFREKKSFVYSISKTQIILICYPSKGLGLIFLFAYTQILNKSQIF